LDRGWKRRASMCFFNRFANNCKVPFLSINRQ
jgi:hypothetical protein